MRALRGARSWSGIRESVGSGLGLDEGKGEEEEVVAVVVVSWEVEWEEGAGVADWLEEPEWCCAITAAIERLFMLLCFMMRIFGVLFPTCGCC